MSTEDYKRIIFQLGLQDYYPEKITFDHVVAIESGTPGAVTLTSLPWIILKKLVMLESKARDQIVHDVCSHDASKGRPARSSKSLKSLAGAFSSAKADIEALSPLDVFLVIYQCCDLLLKQTILHKMFFCKLALPLITPKPFLNVSLWSMRSIVLTHSSTDNTMTQISTVKLPSYIVCAIRLGETSISKSQLLNEILYCNSHKTFHDRDCQSGSARRLLTGGYVEGSWLLPSKTNGAQQRALDKPVLFMNLRGDGCSYEVASILYSLSSTILMVVDIENLGKPEVLAQLKHAHLKCEKVVLVLGSKAASPDESMVECAFAAYKNKVGEDTFDKTETVIKSENTNIAELGNHVKEALDIQLQGCRLTCYDEAVDKMLRAPMHVQLDEIQQYCTKGQDLARDIFSTIKDIKEINEKKRNELIPLQGECWRKWSELQKQEQRFIVNDTIVDKDQIKCKMYTLRQTQVETLKNQISPLIQKFFTYIGQCSGEVKVLNFLLKYLSLLLQEKSKSVLPELQVQRKRCWERLTAEKQKRDTNVGKVRQLDLALKSADIRLTIGQLSLEHLFREIGQIYEAYRCNSKDTHPCIQAHIENMPAIFANLLLNGHSFELMDGDAFNIPAKWVKDVLNAVSQRIGDKKIFVLSVLGVQSSGKSTLLNAMFGVQLATSAGRCTKGVSIRLVPVANSCKHFYAFEYVLVVDTEGLRSQELGLVSQNRDNELATLTLGLGDVTAIVIKGENTADVKDILQIASHAFLRMKIANKNFKMKQKCVFIHNNVPAQNAKQEMEVAQQQLVETLDKLIVEAANEESNCDIRSFKDVINFNASEDVFYVADLWKGDPPMAPINPGYSEKIQQIKQHLIQNATATLTVSEVRTRVDDLWRAILADDFIFSFRNSLEAKAYNMLQRTCSEFTITLERDVTDWINSHAEMEVISCNTETALQECCVDLRLELRKMLAHKEEKVKLDIIDFCQNHNLRCFLEQWQQNKISTLNMHVEEFLHKQKKEIESFEMSRKFDLQSNEYKHNLEKKLIHRSKCLAEQNRGHDIAVSKLLSIWEQTWSKWVDELKLPTPTREKIEVVMQNALMDTFHSNRQLVFEEFKSHPIHKHATPFMKLEGTFLDIQKDEYMSIDRGKVAALVGYFQNFGLGKSEDILKKNALDVINAILHTADIEIVTQCKEGTRFKEHFVKNVLAIIVTGLEAHNKKPDARYKFLPNLKVKLAVHCCCLTYTMYTNMQTSYEDRTGIKGKLNKIKPTTHGYFINEFHKKQKEVTAADLFFQIVKGLVVDRIERLIPREIALDVQNDFFNLKGRLIRSMLMDLLKKESFTNYMAYINNPKASAVEWLSEYIKKKWFTVPESGARTKYADVTCMKSDEMVTKLLQCVPDANDPHFPKTMHGWINQFCQQTRTLKVLAVSDDLFFQVEYTQVTNIKSFTQIVTTNLKNMGNPIQTHFCQQNEIAQVDSVVPEIMVLDRLWGCEDQCPICRESCMDSDANHIKSGYCHTCIQHRPPGIVGVHKSSTNKLVVESCNFKVQSGATFKCGVIQRKCRENNKCVTVDDEHVCHRYRDYKRYLPSWEIAPCAEPDGSKYWCYFMTKYKPELVERYLVVEPDIPHSWLKISKTEALDSLKEIYNYGCEE